jgi:hypothetical protein
MRGPSRLKDLGRQGLAELRQHARQLDRRLVVGFVAPMILHNAAHSLY